MRPIQRTCPRAWFLCVLAVASLVTSAGAQEVAQDLPAGVHREFIAHPTEPELRVELYWKAPDHDGGARLRRDGRAPAMLFVHGHQFGDRPGAFLYVDSGLLDKYAARGYLTMAVSQPGYGRSDGPPDFCGPRSQQAVLAALDSLRRHPRVDAERIAVYGYSRGAITASMAATQDDAFAALILGAGEYDMVEAYDLLDESDPVQGGIKRNITRESGGTPEALRLRSAVHAPTPIRVPTLILHGEDDARVRAESARQLAEVLRRAGTPVELAIFPGVGHSIPRELRQEITERFLERYLHSGGAEAAVAAREGDQR